MTLPTAEALTPQELDPSRYTEYWGNLAEAYGRTILTCSRFYLDESLSTEADGHERLGRRFRSSITRQIPDDDFESVVRQSSWMLAGSIPLLTDGILCQEGVNPLRVSQLMQVYTDYVECWLDLRCRGITVLDVEAIVDSQREMIEVGRGHGLEAADAAKLVDNTHALSTPETIRHIGASAVLL